MIVTLYFTIDNGNISTNPEERLSAKSGICTNRLRVIIKGDILLDNNSIGHVVVFKKFYRITSLCRIESILQADKLLVAYLSHDCRSLNKAVNLDRTVSVQLRIVGIDALLDEINGICRSAVVVDPAWICDNINIVVVLGQIGSCGL